MMMMMLIMGMMMLRVRMVMQMMMFRVVIESYIRIALVVLTCVHQAPICVANANISEISEQI